jgi:hypothetical protein
MKKKGTVKGETGRRPTTFELARCAVEEKKRGRRGVRGGAACRAGTGKREGGLGAAEDSAGGAAMAGSGPAATRAGGAACPHSRATLSR